MVLLGDDEARTPVNGFLHMGPDILCELAEELPEQIRKQGAPQVQALVAVVIPVILVPPAQRDLRVVIDSLEILRSHRNKAGE